MRHTFDLGFAFYASTGYLESAGRPSRAEDLREHRLVLYTDEFRSHPFGACIEQYADTALPVMRVDSVETARSMLAADAGIGVLWCCHGDSVATLERVLPDPVSSLELSVVYHRTLRGSTPRQGRHGDPDRASDRAPRPAVGPPGRGRGSSRAGHE